jgi:hypothetical protein
MAEARPTCSGSIARFALLSLVGLAADGVFLRVLLNVAPDPFSARLLSLLAPLGITIPLSRYADLTPHGTLSVGRAGIIAILVIAMLVNYGLYAAFIATLPSLQPLAAMVLASAASLCFAVFGYVRFACRK